jgi:hypothetical protein
MLYKIAVLILALSAPIPVFAVDPLSGLVIMGIKSATSRPETEKEKQERLLKESQQEQDVKEAREKRERKHLLVAGNYSLLEPGASGTKYGASIGYVLDSFHTFEFEFVEGPFNLDWLGDNIGEIKARHLSVQWRTFGRRSLTFHNIVGLDYNRYNIRLSDQYVDVAGMSEDERNMYIDSMGLMWGVGNRWQTKHGFMFTADWVQIHVPVAVVAQDTSYTNQATDENEKHRVFNRLNYIKHFPRLLAVKLQLGFTF